MKKILFFSLVTFATLVIFTILLFFINRESGKGALQVTSQPQATVYLNGKNIGETPLCRCDPKDQIASGEYTIRLVPREGDFQSFENRIKINPRVLTVVDRTFAEDSSSEGSIITLTKLSARQDLELLVMSFPEKAQLFLDNSLVGETPNFLENPTESDHEIKLIKTGYKEKVARIRTVKGFKLEALVFLGVNPILPQTASTPSAKISISKVKILSTPTGFLRVRSGPSLGSSQIGLVYPNEEYELLKEEEGWFEIKLKDGSLGWVSSRYSQKIP